jgi:uncharacterized repeat protein (TIGR01451 family)
MKYILTLAMLMLPAYAMAATDVQITITAEKVVMVEKDGKKVEKLVPAEVAVSGDVILYTLSFENKGDETAKDVKLIDPVPGNTSYINGSAFGPATEVTFSIDQGETYKKAILLTYEVDGEKRIASPEKYSHIRWLLKSLGAGKSGIVGFRARVK